MAEDQELINIWEDTVNFRELLIGLAAGSMLGFVSYAFALRILTDYLPGQTVGLTKGYALMVGIAGCVCAAVIAAFFVKPKRLLRASDEGPIDRAALLRDLGLDAEEERMAMQNAPAKVIVEMRQLQIYELFADVSRPRIETD